MNIKEKITQHWYFSLPLIILSIMGIYCLGYHVGQWYYDIIH